jgi:hypothetical protein
MIKDNVVFAWAAFALLVTLYMYVHPGMLSTGVRLP